MRAEFNGKIGTMLQFTVGTIEVVGKRYSVGLKDLVPVDGPIEVETGTKETAAVPEAGKTISHSRGVLSAVPVLDTFTDRSVRR